MWYIMHMYLCFYNNCRCLTVTATVDFALIVTFRCLESLISACGKDGSAYIDSELLDIISCTLSSSSRFVRETTFTLLSSVVAADTDFITSEFLMTIYFQSVV